MGKVRTIWEPDVFGSRPSVPLKGLQMGLSIFFHKKRPEPRVLPWQQHRICHSVSCLLYIFGASLKKNCTDISGDILDSRLSGLVGFEIKRMI